MLRYRKPLSASTLAEPSVSEYPSGVDFTVISVPMLPPAPGRLSTMIGCPSDSESFGITVRVRISVMLAGPNATITRIGRLGYSDVLSGFAGAALVARACMNTPAD